MNDLIDRQAAVEIMHAKANMMVGTDGQIVYESAARMIERMPAVGAEPVRHGRWVWNDDAVDWNLGAWVCSECGVRNENIHAEAPGKRKGIICSPYVWAGSQYCPNCGVKMDEEVGGNE